MKAPNPVKVYAVSPEELPHGFGNLGMKLGRRSGPGARTDEERQWWCLRRYLFTLRAVAEPEYPIFVLKGERPDFRCSFGSRRLGIEIAEASPHDQRKRRDFQRTGATAFLGTFRARTAAERLWKADVLRTVRAKALKIAHYEPLPTYTILLYSKSHAAQLTDHWSLVFDELSPLNDRMWAWLGIRCRSLNRVAVICGEWLLLLEPGRVRYYPRRSGIAKEDKRLLGMRGDPRH